MNLSMFLNIVVSFALQFIALIINFFISILELFLQFVQTIVGAGH
jgi:hypothetical protein